MLTENIRNYDPSKTNFPIKQSKTTHFLPHKEQLVTTWQIRKLLFIMEIITSIVRASRTQSHIVNKMHVFLVLQQVECVVSTGLLNMFHLNQISQLNEVRKWHFNRQVSQEPDINKIKYFFLNSFLFLFIQIQWVSFSQL